MLSVQYSVTNRFHRRPDWQKGKGQGNMRDVAIDKITEYAAEDADITLQLKNKFQPLLDNKSVRKVFEEVENPLVKVLADMEFEGIRVDMEFLKEYSRNSKGSCTGRG